MSCIALCVLLFSFVNCCTYHTFDNVSVTLSGVRGVQRIDGCFTSTKQLERVSLIQIIDQNVPVLRSGAFSDLQYLVDIILEKDNIEQVQPGTFHNLPKLYLIRMKHNDFKTINEGIFNGLTVNELSLTDNNIEFIDSKAFNNMPNLNIILMNNNKIARWDCNWFESTPKVTILNFEGNRLDRVPSFAFKNIKGLHSLNNKLNVSTSIHLNNNSIALLEDDAFAGLEAFGWLFLQRNRIADFNARALATLKHLDWLRLDHNELHCIPDTLVQVVPNVKYYLDGNPLSDDCVRKFDIKMKNGHLHKIKISLE